MKDPKALFPVIFATSWLGNLLLTLLAFFLAFTHQGPLTPMVFLTVAACILSGNALPIAVYLIMVRWNEAELQAESAEATVRVREALKRSEEVVARLDEAEGALAKGILIARQVPERISDGLKGWEQLMDRLAELEVVTFTQALEGQSASIGVLQQEIGGLGDALKGLRDEYKPLRADLKSVPEAVRALLEQAGPAAAQPREPDEQDVSLGERLDLVFETLESVQDSLDGLLQRVAELKLAPAPAAAAAPRKPKKEPEPEPAVVVAAVPAQAEMPLEPAVPASRPPVPNDGKTHLFAHAMVGISNRLFLRGDEPLLSWEEGQPMELIGIGEFSWTSDDVKDPTEVSVWLNDEIPAEGANIVLKPGQSVRASPRFPKS